jgi:hypothetical protein
VQPRCRTWWCVDQQVVEQAPADVAQELLDHALLLRPAPDDAVFAALEQKGDTHDGHSLLSSVGVDRHPAVGRLVDALTVEAEHAWDRRAGEVRVKHADAEALAIEREGKLDGRRRLADTALAREHEDDRRNVG